MDFAELCRGSSPVPSDDMLEIVRRTFIYRDNIELLGTERSAGKQFSQLIQDIPSGEGSLQVLQKLTELYPEEAHFWAHLGRFYSVERKDYQSAIDCIGRAIDLDPKDSVLHHVKGMGLRQQVYEMIEKNGALSAVIGLGKQAGSSFGQARDLNPDDEHGYISEVQMLAKILDYAGRIHGGDVMGYLSSPNADPFLRDCLERAEDLLEVVRRNREGQGASRFEEDCRAKIDALYGRYERALQTWDNLLNRKDVYGPPVRRQIVWTYLARRGRSWDAIPVREVDRMVLLLEDNLKEEPASDTNLRLWVQAVRRSSYPPSLEAVIERITYWRARTDSLESSFYLYLLYALQAIEGSSLGRDSAIRFLEECRNKARFRRNRTKSFEWLGKDTGVSRLVHHSQLGEWQTDKDFWDNTAPLARLSGRIANIDAPQAGQIDTEGGLKAFFVPARGDYSRGRSENRAVTFFLGFSYDGLRAWEVKDV
jgi:tetratricopeptide (TPR) repeat protein